MPHSWIVLVVAAALAGALNALAGGGTLITYPALFALGVPPIAANATSTVALVPAGLSAFLGFSHAGADDRRTVAIMVLPSLAGGALGAGLAMWIGNRAFARVVPWLVVGATLLFLVQPLVRRWLGARAPATTLRRPAALQVALQLVIAVYGGFFGAAMGIMMLAMLGLVGHDDLNKMNRLKNLAAFCINGVAALTFFAGGQVRPRLAALMAFGAVAGAFVAARAAAKIDARVIRGLVVAVGVAVFAYTLWKAG